MHTLLLTLSILMAVWSYADLIKDLVWHGKSQPIATRLALCAALALGSISIIIGDGGWGDLMVTLIYSLLSFMVVVLSLPGYKTASTGMSLIDKCCLSLSVIGAVALLFTSNSGVGVAFAIAADLTAYIPTIRAAKRYPHTQPITTYFIGLCAAVFALAATYLERGITSDSMLTVYFVAIDGLLPVFILIRRRQVKESVCVLLE